MKLAGIAMCFVAAGAIVTAVVTKGWYSQVSVRNRCKDVPMNKGKDPSMKGMPEPPRPVDRSLSPECEDRYEVHAGLWSTEVCERIGGKFGCESRKNAPLSRVRKGKTWAVFMVATGYLGPLATLLLVIAGGLALAGNRAARTASWVALAGSTIGLLVGMGVVASKPGAIALSLGWSAFVYLAACAAGICASALVARGAPGSGPRR